MTSILNSYSERVAKFQEQYEKLNTQYNIVATFRVLTFISFLILITFFANERLDVSLGVSIILFPFVFGFIVKKHKRISYQRKHTGFLKQINQQEIDSLNHQFVNFEDGNEFQDKEHDYANDLDVFGRNSLFQMMNRASTKGGKSKLAQWLLRPAKREEINLRQEAVKELSEKLDWRQDLQARGMHFSKEQLEPESLIEWIKTKNPVAKGFTIAAYAMPVLIIGSIILNFVTEWPAFMTIILAVISGVVLNRFQDRIKDLTEQVLSHTKLLGAYSSMLEVLENSTFNSMKLNKLKLAIAENEDKASKRIEQLYQVLDFLNARANFFYSIIDILFLFDLHIILYAERWKKTNESDISSWFDAISELEALSSLANFSHNYPTYTFPEITDEPYILESESLGHPLIKGEERICNDYKLDSKGTISIITGSNMSGKSTFLRTLGVNVVLGLAGAPVCAKKMTLSFMQIFTSMRTQDNLEEHVSSFYAELKRIKQLLSLAADEKPTLFMLDEILKGTNSQDRHIGAVALAKQLSFTNSFGLISTHDLALGDLAKEMTNISNYSFNSQIQGDEIIFPYTLEEGVCKSFNASKLMEQIGIRIN